MCKRKLVWLYFFEFLFSVAVITAVTVLLSGMIPLLNEKPWPGIIAGGVLMVAAIPLCINGKRHKVFYYATCILNAVASGLFTASYFTFVNKTPDFVDMLPPVTIVTALMLLRCVVLLFDKAGIVINFVLLALNFAGGIAAIVLWIIHGGIFFPMLLFLLIPEFVQGAALLISVDESEPISDVKIVSVASFSYAFVIGLIAVFILSEGEILDGFDAFIDTPSKKVKKGK